MIIGGDTITVIDQFGNNQGIEQITFSDAVTWDLDDILSRTRDEGQYTVNDVLEGLAHGDNLYGMSGSDTLSGNNGESMTEVDTLALKGLDAGDIDLTKSGVDLVVTIGSAKLTVQNGFASSTESYGSEIIAFDSGEIIRILNDDVAIVQYFGGAGDQAPTSAWNLRDEMYGGNGHDTLNAKNGNDTLYGGNGTDSLIGGNGADHYMWLASEDGDTIYDMGESLTEVDTLVLGDVLPDAVTLERLLSSPHDLRVVIGGVVHIVQNRFYSTEMGYGIEAISFADGTLWTLDEIMARTETRGDSSANSLSGTGYRDNLFGKGGADTLSGGAGDDHLTGSGDADSLTGGTGNDNYLWSRGDGTDTFNDTISSQTETDTLVLGDVLAGDVTLTRINGTSNLGVAVAGTDGATHTVINQYTSALSGTGIERIVFADGSSWDQTEMFARAQYVGTESAETLSGSAERDNIYGAGANDSLVGGGGDDWLYGGGGNDTLKGGAGADTYVWSHPAGSDIIEDGSALLAEIDTLILRNVDSSLVTLHRPNLSDEMEVRFNIGGTT